MTKAIFFDFDGVLTTDATGTTSIVNYIRNTTDIDAEAFEKTYRKHNTALLYGKTTHNDMWPQLCIELKQIVDLQVLYDAFMATPMDTTMLHLARKLKAEGYILGIITDNKKDRIDTICEKYPLRAIFETIVISSEIGSGKKHHTIFNAAIRDCDVHYNECIFIDNTRENLVIPQALGMKTLYFDHEERDVPALAFHIREILQKNR